MLPESLHQVYIVHNVLKSERNEADVEYLLVNVAEAYQQIVPVQLIKSSSPLNGSYTKPSGVQDRALKVKSRRLASTIQSSVNAQL